MQKRETLRSLIDDEIVSIEYLGVLPTYDMTVPETHCFFGNGVLVHNSGEIEEDADVVMFLHRERDAEDTILRVAKNRNGPTGDAELRFQRSFVRYTEGVM